MLFGSKAKLYREYRDLERYFSTISLLAEDALARQGLATVAAEMRELAESLETKKSWSQLFQLFAFDRPRLM